MVAGSAKGVPAPSCCGLYGLHARGGRGTESPELNKGCGAVSAQRRTLGLGSSVRVKGFGAFGFEDSGVGVIVGYRWLSGYRVAGLC